jgi:pyruvate formate lyase activating enzyme
LGEKQGYVINIQKYSLHDGPGIRTIVFLKGCPLRCKWCCNPEGQSFLPELKVTYGKCDGCGRCVALCPQKALSVKDGIVAVDRAACSVCGKCEDFCWTGALEPFGRYYTVDEMYDYLIRDEAFYKSLAAVSPSEAARPPGTRISCWRSWKSSIGRESMWRLTPAAT